MTILSHIAAAGAVITGAALVILQWIENIRLGSESEMDD